MQAYSDGRDAILGGLFKVLTSILTDYFGSKYEQDYIKQVSANIINRMALRPEPRPDPREGEDDLLVIWLNHICRQPLIKEAIALVLLLDVFLGPSKELDDGYRRIEYAFQLGGSETKSIYDSIHPLKADVDTVRRITLTVADTLIMISEGKDGISLFQPK